MKFSIGFVALVGVSALVARHPLSSSRLRSTTILAGPVIRLFALDAVMRLPT